MCVCYSNESKSRLFWNKVTYIYIYIYLFIIHNCNTFTPEDYNHPITWMCCKLYFEWRVFEWRLFEWRVFEWSFWIREFLIGEFLNGEFLIGEFLIGEFLNWEFLNGDLLPPRKTATTLSHEYVVNYILVLNHRNRITL